MSAFGQGEIYWLQLEGAGAQEARIPHPHVIIQDDPHDPDKVIACGLTTHLGRISVPGNVLLERGEGNLPKQSVIEVSKVAVVKKAQLGGYIGSLSAGRVKQIFAGMRFLERSFLGDDDA